MGLQGIGKRIREERKRQNISGRALAKSANISPSYESDIELGKTNPSLETLEAIAHALNVKIAYLLDECTTKNQAPASEKKCSTAAQDLDRLLKKVAAEQPDTIIYLRSVIENLDEMDEEDMIFLADGLRLALGQTDKLVKAKKVTRDF